MRETIVVNLFGAPGTGKSTGAAYIFSKLKMDGFDAELVTEFAKDKVWEENKEVFNSQIYLFGKQAFRISRCYGKVDVIITDSPLPLAIYYKNQPCYTENFDNCVMDIFKSYNNINYYLTRVKPYNPNGRFQTEEQADIIAKDIKNILNNFNINYLEAFGDENGYNKIVKDIEVLIKTKNLIE